MIGMMIKMILIMKMVIMMGRSSTQVNFASHDENE